MSKRKQKLAVKLAGEVRKNVPYQQTLADETGLVNPELDRMTSLIRQREDFRKIADRIKRIGRRCKGDIVSMMHDPEMRACYERYFIAVAETEAVPDARSDLPPPPDRAELYQRITNGTKIHDIGSGDSRKIEQKLSPVTAHLDVVYTDPMFNQETAGMALQKESADAVITTFMAATQFTTEEWEKCEEFDGLHIMPDVVQLAGVGVSRDIGRGLYASEYKDKVFYDRVIAAKGYPIRFGYKAVNTYRKEDIEIAIVTSCKQSSTHRFDPDATASADLLTGDFGYKYDGIAKQIQICDGVVRIFDRNGDYLAGNTKWKGSMVLNVEDVGMCYILHRVVNYRGYIPFHSGACLRWFPKRKRIKINNKPIIGPYYYHSEAEPYFKDEDGSDMIIPYDGIVYRYRERDFYTKWIWTVDVANMDSLVEYLERHCWHVEILKNAPDDGLAEYSMRVPRPGRVIFEYSKMRDDKDRIDTNAQVLTKLEYVMS